MGTPSRRRVSWGTHTLHFSNPLLFIYIAFHSHSFSASITSLDRSFLTYILFLLWKVLALKSKGFLSFFLVVCTSSSKHSLLVLQVSDLVERTLGCPKDIHTTLKGPPRGLVAISQPYSLFFIILVRFVFSSCLLVAHTFRGISGTTLFHVWAIGVVRSSLGFHFIVFLLPF